MSDSIIIKPLATKTIPKDDKKPKKQPPYAVIIENDDHHTFDYVVEILQKIFNVKLEDATMMTFDIHKQGRRHVWTGTKELAELKVEQVKNFGEDKYAAVSPKYSLICYMEPMPQ